MLHPLYLILLLQFILIFAGSMISASLAFVVSYIILITPGAHKLHSIKVYCQSNSRLIISWLMFIIWALLSCSWSIDQERSLVTILKSTAITLVSIVALANLAGQGKTLPKTAPGQIINIMLLLNGVILFEHLTNYQITLLLRQLLHINNELRQPIDKETALLIMSIPVLYTSYYHKSVKFLLLAITTIISVIVHPMLATLVAAILASLAWLGTWLFGRRFIILFFSMMITLLSLAPLIFYYVLTLPFIQHQIIPKLPLSWLYRVQMWEKTSFMVMHQPLTGYGINSSVATNQLAVFKSQVGIQIHPHNMFLQIWLELGAIGVALFALFLLAIGRLVMNISNKKQASSIMAFLAAILAFAMISFGMWHSWFICAVWLAIMTNCLARQENLSPSR